MKDETTRDLREYTSRGRANVRGVRSARKPIVPVQVFPMCEACGVRDDTVRDVEVGLFKPYARRLCAIDRKGVWA